MNKELANKKTAKRRWILNEKGVKVKVKLALEQAM
jgi:hypothetical protein